MDDSDNKTKKKPDKKAHRNARRRKLRLEKHTGIDWIDPEQGYGKVRGEQALWRAVILQMLEDAASNSKKPNDIFNRDQARNWLQGTHRDFAMVCDLAGLNVQYVRKKVKHALLNHCKWRDDTGQKNPARNVSDAKAGDSRQPRQRAAAKPSQKSTKASAKSADILAFQPFMKKSA